MRSFSNLHTPLKPISVSYHMFFFQLMFFAEFEPPHSRLQVKHFNRPPIHTIDVSCCFPDICTIVQLVL